MLTEENRNQIEKDVAASFDELVSSEPAPGVADYTAILNQADATARLAAQYLEALETPVLSFTTNSSVQGES